MQMPDILEGYRVIPTSTFPDHVYVTPYKKRGAAMFKDTWPTLSKGTQENAMKLTLLLTLRARTGPMIVEGVGAVYVLGSMGIVIVPEENDDDY